ncbi:MAG: hypothetical protein NVSMB52_03610 [Chloroflexota bacterium]
MTDHTHWTTTQPGSWTMAQLREWQAERKIAHDELFARMDAIRERNEREAQAEAARLQEKHEMARAVEAARRRQHWLAALPEIERDLVLLDEELDALGHEHHHFMPSIDRP